MTKSIGETPFGAALLGAALAGAIVGGFAVGMIREAELSTSKKTAKLALDNIVLCQEEKKGLEIGIDNYVEREEIDHVKFKNLGAQIKKLTEDLRVAQEDVKYWENRRRSRVEVPEWARDLWLSCAERQKTCDWENSTIKKRVLGDGTYQWKVYNKCEIELTMCDRLIDSVTDPKAF